MAKRFTKEELDNIIEDYQNGMTPKDLEIKYNRKSATIINKLSDMGIYKKKTRRISKEDIDFLKENYPIGNYNAIFERFPEYDKQRIASICHSHGIKRDNYRWSDSDVDIIKQHYYTNTLEEIAEMIGYRHSCDAIQTKAYKNGILER